MADILSSIINLSNKSCYERLNSFYNVYSGKVEATLSAYGLVRPVTAAQMDTLSTRQKVDLLKSMVTMLGEAISLAEFHEEAREIKDDADNQVYSDLSALVADLPNRLTGEDLVRVETNLQKANEVRNSMAGLIDSALLAALIGGCVNGMDKTAEVVASLDKV